MEAFLKFVRPGYDLAALAFPPQAVTWKTAADPVWLAQVEGLLEPLLEIAPNGVLASAKVKSALQKIASKHKINYTKMRDCDFLDAADQYVRMGLAQLRGLKKSPELLTRFCRKASGEEQAAAQRLLSMLKVEDAGSVMPAGLLKDEKATGKREAEKASGGDGTPEAENLGALQPKSQTLNPKPQTLSPKP